LSFIRFKNVGKIYRSIKGLDYPALKDFDLEIEQKQFFCLLGTSGCGKTTVLNALAGFESVTSGSIEVSGRPVTAPGADRGVVFQGDDSLYTWLNNLGNVEFGLRMRGVSRREREERARYFLELVGLKGQEHKYPQELSGGMKQRVQIARVLANEPDILLMDEPFGALDAQTRAVMQRELSRIWQATGKTILFITHDIDEAMLLATQIGVMYAGPASRIKAIINNPLELQDRDRGQDKFVALYREVHNLIQKEVDITMRNRGE
jgi:NitT/TauT family transport system ATP-binding protein